jgi:hypothetical protein
MIIINYLVNQENVYQKPTYSDKILNHGDASCLCVNSIYGPNLNTNPSNKCPLNDSSNNILTQRELLDILNTNNKTSDIMKEKIQLAQGCLNYYYYDINGELILPKNYTANMILYDINGNKLTRLTHNYVPITNFSQNFYLNIESTYSTLIDIYHDIKYDALATNTSLATNPLYKQYITSNGTNSIYSTDLGYNKGTTNEPYKNDITCKSKVDNSGNNMKPLYLKQTNVANNVTCVNTINLDNVSANSISFDNIVMSNICGNTAPVSAVFPSQLQTSNSCANNGNTFINQ